MFGGEGSRKGENTTAFYPRSPARSMGSTGTEQSPVEAALMAAEKNGGNSHEFAKVK